MAPFCAGEIARAELGSEGKETRARTMQPESLRSTFRRRTNPKLPYSSPVRLHSDSAKRPAHACPPWKPSRGAGQRATHTKAGLNKFS